MPVKHHSAGQAAFAFDFAPAVPEPVAPRHVQTPAATVVAPVAPPPPPVCEVVEARESPVVAMPAPAITGKACKTCGAWKPVDAYHVAARGALGRDAHCRACVAAKWKAAHTPKRPRPLPAPLDARGEPVTKQCKTCGEVKPLDAFNVQLYAARYRAKRRGHYAEKHRQWKKRNPGRMNAYGARRKTAKLKASPVWLDVASRVEIDGVYFYCSLFYTYTVGHVVPLQGKTVRGLHVPWNLQPLTKSQNSKKHNKLLAGLGRGEGSEFGTKWDIRSPDEWWSREWFLMGFD